MALTTAVHQTEGSQPEIILTCSCWPPRQEGGPVLHSWWPPSPPSFFPITHSSTGWIPTPLLLALESEFPYAGDDPEHWVLWGTQSHAGYPRHTGSTTWLQQLLPRSHISSSALLPCCCTPWQGSLAPGGSSPSSTGGWQSWEPSKASCKPKCCPAGAGSD